MSELREKMVLPCLRGVIGDWVYYSSLMTAKQINVWIGTAKSIRESATLDDYLQRTLKDRKAGIANYLIKNNSHFFNSIIVGVFGDVPDWAEFDLSKASDFIGDAAATKEMKESIGLMIFQGHEQMFAIDGQHRVEGIKIAYGGSNSKVVLEDQYSVIFIAHVDDLNGKKRTRRLFSDINKKAVPVAKGDRIVIDEEDLAAIVARRIYSNYPAFDNGKLISLTENPKLEDNDTSHFTNLLSIYTICKNLVPLHKKPNGVDKLSEENIILLFTIVSGFLDWLIDNVDDLKAYFIDKTINLAEVRKDNKHLMFRPVGLALVSKVYSIYNKAGKLDILTQNIKSISFVMPESIYHKVLWFNNRIQATGSFLTLAVDLTRYILGDITDIEKIQILLEKYRSFVKNDAATLPEKIV